jgi:hypothetical protein
VSRAPADASKVSTNFYDPSKVSKATLEKLNAVNP